MGARAAIVLSFLLLVSSWGWASSSMEEVAEPVTEEVAEPLTEEVLVLDIHNFTDAVEEYDFLVVEFYAPWCGHCKNLAPEYEAAAVALKSHHTPITLAKVDLSEEVNKPLAAEFDIKGFPTLKILRNKGAVVQEYKGPREAAGIVSYLKKLSGPSSVELTSAEQAEVFLFDHGSELAIIGVFDSLDSEEYKNFSLVAEELRLDYYFAHTADASFVPDNGVPLKAPSIRLHKDFDDKIVDFADFSVGRMATFIDVESLPLITEMSKKPEHRPALIKFFESYKDKVYLFLASSEEEPEEESTALISSFRKDALAFKERGVIFLFGYESESSNALQFFGLSASSDLPAYVIQSDKGKKYLLKNIESGQLAPFVDDYLGGRLVEHVKSDPIPLTNDEPVKVIVAKSLQEAVLDSGKDVFLEFYAPWCGHCKKLAPTLDEVARSFASDPDVVIAKFDATTNDVPSELFDVKGFPTIYFHSAAGNITQFDGDRTKEGIIEFINAHRSKSDSVLEETVTGNLEAKDEL